MDQESLHEAAEALVSEVRPKKVNLRREYHQASVQLARLEVENAALRERAVRSERLVDTLTKMIDKGAAQLG
jgi:hypothetical protein